MASPTRETTFSEVMSGAARLLGGGGHEPAVRLDLDVAVPGLLTLWGDSEARLAGRVVVEGVADDPGATGTLQIAPLRRRRLRYQLSFHGTDGRQLRLDGWKSVNLLRPIHSMTTLPVTLYDDRGGVVGEAVLRFDIRSLPRFLAGFRYRRSPSGVSRGAGVWGSRWRGQAGRLEVWYTTLSDPTTGTGAWLHQEIVAPEDGCAPYQHGWIVVFPPNEQPLLHRVAPHDVAVCRDGDPLASSGITWRPELLSGDTGDAAWSLTADHTGSPLFTFPSWAWRSELLPAAQVVATPGARFDGSIRIGAREFAFRGAPGASSRIYGHGNARRWTWLHSDLDDGVVIEVVSAVSTLPLLRRLPPLTFVRLRTSDGDWPTHAGLLTAARMHARIGLPTWSVRGRIGGRRIRVEVRMPAEQTVTLDYAEPSGDRVVCRNSERADVTVEIDRRERGRWRSEHRWSARGTAHAEVGGRE